MANLGAYQKISRVLPGQPFGNGSDGAYSSATIPTLTKDSCSGSATSTTLTTAGSTFANGDIILIHQSRGTGVGQWEINRVASGGGSTSLTLQVALNYTYTDSGASQAQAVKIPQYTDVTVESGTWTVDSWDKNKGGILVFASKGTTTVTGTISAVTGFAGGTGSDTTANCGEGSAADSSATQSANGNGGGGGTRNPGVSVSGGGGGGNAAAGSNGEAGTGISGGTGGAASGAADLTTITFGGAGGGGTRSAAPYASGGKGGSIVMIFAKAITIAGAITSSGTNGETVTATSSGGGGGAGGSVLIACGTGTLGTNKITTPAGTGGAGADQNGGDGAVGRVAIHHSGAITGTSTPSLTDVTDTTLVESLGGSFLFNFI